MSNAGVNTAFAKCFILFMTVVILLQGIVYLGLSIWGLTNRHCSKEASDLSSEPFEFAMDLIYFLDKDCGNPSVRLPGITEPIPLDVDFNKADFIATRTFVFLISYAVISSLWIVASLSVITSLCGTITRTVNNLCVCPWFIVVVAGSILDAVATGFHIHDITKTASALKTFQYLGISASNKTVDAVSNFNGYFITPAVIMTCISSRVILIWLLNIFGASFCLSLSKTLLRRNSTKDSNCCNINIPQEAQQVVSPVQTQQYEEHPRGAERSRPTLPSLTIKSFQEHPIASAQSDESSTNGKLSKVPASNLMSATSPSSENNDYNIIKNNSDGSNCPLPRNIFQYQQQLSPISPLNNRYSTNNESFQYLMQNQRVSEELRGQLPWSYTSFPPPVPKKPQMQVYPEIPTPDYGY